MSPMASGLYRITLIFFFRIWRALFLDTLRFFGWGRKLNEPQRLTTERKKEKKK